jgi:hypothetical protein
VARGYSGGDDGPPLPLQCMQRPGEIMFVPSGYVHFDFEAFVGRVQDTCGFHLHRVLAQAAQAAHTSRLGSAVSRLDFARSLKMLTGRKLSADWGRMTHRMSHATQILASSLLGGSVDPPSAVRLPVHVRRPDFCL